MRAAVIRAAGDPEVLGIEDWPMPSSCLGQVLIRVKAFGLNLFVRLTPPAVTSGVRRLYARF